MFFAIINAQTLRPIPAKVASLHALNKNFNEVNLFVQDNTASKMINYRKDALDATVMQIDKAALKQIINEKPETFTLNFPIERGEVSVELYKVQILTPEFKVNTDKGYVDYTPGVYYRGIIRGDEKSVAAFSFFENEVIGVASDLINGNIVLGKGKDSEDYVTYTESKLTGTNSFICNTDDLEENHKSKISFDPNKVISSGKMTENCVRIYYEICNTPFKNNGSDTTTTTNWITGVHNNISTLYSNDNIQIALNEVYIWTTADPYTGNYSQNLASFRTNRQTFNGDLAHLINSPATTSVAYVNSLCTTYKHAYSGISKSYGVVPTYSWTIQAMTHEMGHSLGSPHTHACAWNGDDTAIDGCGAIAGYSEGCDAELPTAGGTIMSYCHLISTVGISFANGFGDQPAALIRQTVESKGCLGTNCTTACTITVANIATSNIAQTSFAATIADNSSTSWKYRVTTTDGTVITEGTTTTKVINVTDLQPGTYYYFMVGTDCSGSEAFQRQVMVLTDADWCSGLLFTDSGGADRNYKNSESFVKTFYPSSADSKLTLTFTEFDLEQSYDYMYVYNGTTATSATIFSNGNLLTGGTNPGPFTSTHSTGAITVRFIADAGTVATGWKANFSCTVLGINEAAKLKDVTVSPNPAKSFVNLSGFEKVLEVTIYDVSGKLVKTISDVNAKEAKLDISSLKAGNYVLNIKTETQTVAKKLIKQ